jgi:hypothetical protein
MKYNISPEDYSSMLTSIELREVLLSKCDFKTFETTQKSGSIGLKFNDKYSYTQAEKTAAFKAAFKLEGISTNNEASEKIFSMSGEFTLDYEKVKEVTLNDDFFQVFKDMSLTLIIWPYFREIIQNMVARTGYPSLTLPARYFNTSDGKKNK